MGGADERCCDAPPPGDFTCSQQVEWGKCADDWLIEGGYCALSCGFCNAAPEKPLYLFLAGGQGLASPQARRLVAARALCGFVVLGRPQHPTERRGQSFLGPERGQRVAFCRGAVAVARLQVASCSSPLASSPFASSPLASSPLASSLLASSPLASSPLASCSSPLASCSSSSPLASSPLASCSSPLAS